MHMAEVVEHLSSKHKAWIQNPNTNKENRKKAGLIAQELLTQHA